MDEHVRRTRGQVGEVILELNRLDQSTEKSDEQRLSGLCHYEEGSMSTWGALGYGES